MDDALRWRPGALSGQLSAADAARPVTGTTAGFGGDDRGMPVLIAVLHGPVEAAMAQDALNEAGIPTYVKQHSLGQVYGLTIGTFGAAEVWVVRTLADQARDILIGLGLLEPADESAQPPATARPSS